MLHMRSDLGIKSTMFMLKKIVFLNLLHVWFLEINFVRLRVLCACVYITEAINNYSHEMKPE